MPGFVQISSTPTQVPATCAPLRPSSRVLWLQGVTLAWMLIECGVSLYAAATAQSPALLAFGADSLVELLSATVVLLQYGSPAFISPRRAGRIAGALLLILACVVACTALLTLVLHWKPETSRLGVIITLSALVAMPILATLKRREARRNNDSALAADAIQSATCAYLGLITLLGLAVNAVFHIPWFDSLAAVAAVPILVYEARSAWQGNSCGCC